MYYGRRTFYVYILASQKNGTLYIGVTNNLWRRVEEHAFEVQEGFTQKYHVHKLVYFEEYVDIRQAIQREKRMKKWKREWKIKLVEETNPGWRDLYFGDKTP